MKNNSLKILPIFLTIPFLLAMYNGPHFYEYNIDDYDLTYVSHEQIDDEYIYTCNFKNNRSTAYVSSISLSGTIEEEKYELTLCENGFSNIFRNYNCVVPPQYEGTVRLSSAKEISDLSKLEKDGRGFSLSDNSIEKEFIYTSNIESITLKPIDQESVNPFYYYVIKFNENVENIYSCGVFEVNYNGETAHLLLESSKEGYHFSTSEELDLTKLTVKSITLVKTYRPFSINTERLGELTAIYVAIMVVIHVGIFCAIFFPVRHMLRKKRKAQTDIK